MSCTGFSLYSYHNVSFHNYYCLIWYLQFEGLIHSQMYNLKIFCCNSAECSDVLEKAIATLLLVTPELSGDLIVADKTETEIRLKLPSFKFESNIDRLVIRSISIFCCHR